MRRMGMGLCLGTRERAAVAHVEDVDDKAQARGLCVCVGGHLLGWGGVGWGGIHCESYDDCHDDRELKRGRARGVGSGLRLGASARGVGSGAHLHLVLPEPLRVSSRSLELVYEASHRR